MAAERHSVPSWVCTALLVTALLPLLASLGSQSEAVDGAAALTAVCALVASAALVWRRALIQPTRLSIAWAAFLAIGFVSLLLSDRGWTAFMGEATSLSGWASLVAVTAIGWAAGLSSRSVGDALLRVAPWVVLAESVYALGQMLGGGIAIGTLPNSTYLGEALLLLVPWVFVASNEEHRRGWAWRMSIAVVAVGTLAASGSRTAAILGMFWLAWAATRLDFVSVRARWFVGAGAVVAVLLAGLTFARADVLGAVGVEALGERPEMWRVAAAAVAERPLLGWAPDGFVAGGASVTTPELAERGLRLVFAFGSTDPHNLLVFVAVSIGLVGLALFGWFGVEAVLRWRALRGQGLLAAPAVWALLLTLGVALTAPLALQVWALLALVSGLSLAPLAKRTAEAGWQRPVSWFVITALGLSSFAFGASALIRLPFEAHGPEESLGKAASVAVATRLVPFDPHLAYLASLHLGYAVQQDRELAAQLPDLAAIERASALDGRSPFYALEYARTLKFHGTTPGRVESAYLEALKRYPGFPVARAEYALFLAEQGRDVEARREIAIARLVDKGDPLVAKAIEAAELGLSH